MAGRLSTPAGSVRVMISPTLEAGGEWTLLTT